MQAKKIYLWIKANIKELEHPFWWDNQIVWLFKNVDEPCVYNKTSGSAVVFLILYMDDILLIENDIPILQSIKIWLSQKCYMKDLDDTSYILGIKIYKDRAKKILSLSQWRYIDLVLKRFNMEGNKRGYLLWVMAYNSLRRCLLRHLKREIEWVLFLMLRL